MAFSSRLYLFFVVMGLATRTSLGECYEEARDHSGTLVSCSSSYTNLDLIMDDPDLRSEEQKIFDSFADKIRYVKDQFPKKMLQMLYKYVGIRPSNVSIGIIGSSGAGKSTFINSFRGLRPKDKGAAKVGTTETTMDIEQYSHPEHKHVILIDFPGVDSKLEGGTLFTMGEYMWTFEKKMKDCDVFLVFTSDRVHNNTVWIAMKAKELGKKVLFVRSKFDQDVENMKRDYPDNYQPCQRGQEKREKRLLKEHRREYVSKLEALGYEHADIGDVFIISGILGNIQRGRWDATALKEAILRQLNIQQKMLFITTCQDFSPTMVKAKTEIFKEWAWLFDLYDLETASPFIIPNRRPLREEAVVLSVVMLLKRGFGLDEDSVSKLANMSGKNPEELQSFVDERMSLVDKIAQFLEGELEGTSLMAAFDAAGRGGRFNTAFAVDAFTSIPIVGGLMTIVGGLITVYSVSDYMDWHVLDVAIDYLEECALDLYELAGLNRHP